jgi:hypothetical protein
MQCCSSPRLKKHVGLRVETQIKKRMMCLMLCMVLRYLGLIRQYVWIGFQFMWILFLYLGIFEHGGMVLVGWGGRLADIETTGTKGCVYACKWDKGSCGDIWRSKS